ncbi:MAG: hypothetical protein DMD79_24530, partial [Candidatus Rokuibacteriota bacterium]
DVQPVPQVVDEVQHDVSAPLREMIPAAPGRTRTAPSGVIPLLRPKPERPPAPPPPPDPGLQTVAPARGKHHRSAFPGVGANGYAPPDTNGAAGTTQYVQWVNVRYAVYDKATGHLLFGPAAGNSFWSGFGGPCETHNSGDIIAQFDKAAGRWVMAQPVYSSPFMYCVAISTTADATGSYHRYAFTIPNNYFPDYPKVGVWPDGYYVSFNAFDASGSFFLGALVCALDRNAMLAGNAATAVCFQNGSSVDSLLPSDLDGSTPPPAGAPNPFVYFVSNALHLYEFHADFASPGNSTFTGPTTIPVNPFSEACGGGACMPQAGTGQQLDSLGDRLMYRLAYRNFGDHESLVVNHSVTAGSSVGVRWYELRQTPPASGGFAVYQQGTFAPDAKYRWMGSIAMDGVGDIALGYSVSSGTTHPSIAYTVHVPGTDAPGTMQAETTLLTGTGSQTGGLDRWGDYSSMSIDPVDDCTFWYTTEYLSFDGSFNWSTLIASFALPSCTGAAPTPDFSLSASPSAQTVVGGGSTSYTVSVAAVNGFTGSVTLSASGLPADDYARGPDGDLHADHHRHERRDQPRDHGCPHRQSPARFLRLGHPGCSDGDARGQHHLHGDREQAGWVQRGGRLRGQRLRHGGERDVRPYIGDGRRVFHADGEDREHGPDGDLHADHHRHERRDQPRDHGRPHRQSPARFLDLCRARLEHRGARAGHQLYRDRQPAERLQCQRELHRERPGRRHEREVHSHLGDGRRVHHDDRDDEHHRGGGDLHPDHHGHQRRAAPFDHRRLDGKSGAQLLDLRLARLADGDARGERDLHRDRDGIGRLRGKRHVQRGRVAPRDDRRLHPDVRSGLRHVDVRRVDHQSDADRATLVDHQGHERWPEPLDEGGLDRELT